MSTVKDDITNGWRPIKDGSAYVKYFPSPDYSHRIIIPNSEYIDDTVKLMQKVCWKYKADAAKIAQILKGDNTNETLSNIWNFCYTYIQYKIDIPGEEQIRRPARSFADRNTGIDCDCFSTLIGAILLNLQIPFKFRITKYDGGNAFQHVYVVVPTSSGEIVVDPVLSKFNYEKKYSQKKDYNMPLKGLDVAVLGKAGSNPKGQITNILFSGLGNVNPNSQEIHNTLVLLRQLMETNPETISTVDSPREFTRMLDYALKYWDTDRDRALKVLELNEAKLNQINGFSNSVGFIDEDIFDTGLDDDIPYEKAFISGLGSIFGSAAGKAKRAAKKAEKKAKPKKKGFFTKIGEAIKKGGKAFVRFNPVTVAARNGFLLFLKLNIGHVAQKLKPGYSGDAKAKKALTEIEKLYVGKLQGKTDKLKNAITKSHSKANLKGYVDDGQYSTPDANFRGLGAGPAAGIIVAALPVIGMALKAMVDSGLMTKKEAEVTQSNLEAGNDETGRPIALDPSDPDIKDEGEPAATDDRTFMEKASDFVSENKIAVGVTTAAVVGVGTYLLWPKGKKKAAAPVSGLSGHKKTYKKHDTQAKKLSSGKKGIKKITLS
ncbi:MAG: hypothetical protein WC707_07005 [Candidatus Babeliaceae bacterium]|jgi:hypothetical protein